MISYKEALKIAKESKIDFFKDKMYDWPNFYVVGNDAEDFKIYKDDGKIESFDHEDYRKELKELDLKYGENEADNLIKEIDISNF